MEEMILTTKWGAIIYDQDMVPAPTNSLFDPNTHVSSSAINTLGRGSALVFQLNGIPVVLKHYKRGGLFGKLVKNRYRYSGIENTRMFKEFRLLNAMREKGLPVPSPVAAQAIRYGLTYSGDLITVKIDNAETFAEKLFEDALAEQIWQLVGSTIRQFHDHNVYHADLNANNIMIDNQNTVYLIDFDKSKFIDDNNGWKEKNLARLLRSLRKIKKNNPHFLFKEENWAQLIQGYQAAPTTSTTPADA